MIVRKTFLTAKQDIFNLIKTTCCDSNVYELLTNKALHEIIIIENIDNRSANILKQEALSIGLDVAVSCDVSKFKKGVSTAVLFGSNRNIIKLSQKLLLQPFSLSDLSIKLKDLVSTTHNKILKHNNGSINYSDKTLVMGILNLDKNSFSGDGITDIDQALQRALQIQKDGADIIDIGAVSSRPGSKPVLAKEEIRRLVPVIKKISKSLIIPISVDTYLPEVAKAAISEGANIINDISGGTNKKMLQIVSSTKSGFIIMHMKGLPQTMQKSPKYKNIFDEVFSFLDKQAKLAQEAGINSDYISIDPGIGFGKTVSHNLNLMKNIADFSSLKYALTVGVSRKKFIGNIIKTNDIEQRNMHTLPISTFLSLKGVNIVRVHDVKNTVDSFKILDAIRKQ